MNADLQPGGALLHITLLAAGFIIGEGRLPSWSFQCIVSKAVSCEADSSILLYLLLLL